MTASGLGLSTQILLFGLLDPAEELILLPKLLSSLRFDDSLLLLLVVKLFLEFLHSGESLLLCRVSPRVL